MNYRGRGRGREKVNGKRENTRERKLGFVFKGERKGFFGVELVEIRGGAGGGIVASGDLVYEGRERGEKSRERK